MMPNNRDSNKQPTYWNDNFNSTNLYKIKNVKCHNKIVFWKYIKKRTKMLTAYDLIK